MRKFKKWLITALCASCAVSAGAAIADWNEEVTASAAVATQYTVVDTSLMAKISENYTPNGNFNLSIILPQIDTAVKKDAVTFDGVDLAKVFNDFGFFDKVKIGEKTLREYGCVSFWDGAIGFGVGEPQNSINLHCHADPDIWKEAVKSGEVSLGTWGGSQWAVNPSDVTIEEGTLIPGYTYLNGDDDAVVYRASCTYVSQASVHDYSWESHGQTDIEAFDYVQAYNDDEKEKCGYIGVSLKGDDYLGNGEQAEITQTYYYENFASRVLVNGEAGKVKYYGLFNLGDAGKGYYAFQITMPEENIESITVPAGTLFPSRAMNTLRELNKHNVFIVYETQTDKTFYKNAEGQYVSFEGYAEMKTEELQALYNEKVAAGCFEADVTAMETAISAASTAMQNATTIAGVDEAFTVAKTAINDTQTKQALIASAKAELNEYKAEEGYFRTAEKTQRDTAVANAQSSIDSAASKEAVTQIVSETKAAIDALKTAAQYADEELAGEKANARAEIESYQAEIAYLADEAAARAAAVEAGLAAVAAAKSAAEIEAAVTNAKTTIDGIETKAAIVDAAKADLDGYKAEEGLYREAQATERANLIATAKTAIDNAADKAAVNEAVAAAKAAIDELKTDAQLTEEEKNAANAALMEKKAEAVTKVNEIKAGVDFSLYTSENHAKINELYKTAKDLIEDALTEEEINAAVSAFETEIGKLPTADANEDNTSDVTDGGANGGALAALGCGSVIGVSSITALTCALGVAAIALKKRKED